MTVAIIEQDKLVYTRRFGLRNNNNQPVTPNTIFDIASLTKSFSATLLAHQIDQEKSYAEYQSHAAIPTV